jgi:redox-sensitive bicupin YhaK (pirin superfamily)
MSLPHIPDPLPGDVAAADALEMVIVPRARDLGDFEVRRALPSAQKQMVGPFIFFDQFGPGCAAAPAYWAFDSDLGL